MNTDIIIIILLVVVSFLILGTLSNIFKQLDIIQAQNKWTQEKIEHLEEEVEATKNEVKATQDIFDDK
jgi:outer membrane murein-binding lipoprotein Lpp